MCVFLCPSKSLDVSAIFFQQSSRPILRVSLEVYEQTVSFFLHKQINARLRRLHQNFIAAGIQRIRSNFVPSRMRNPHRVLAASRQRVVPNFFVLENAELLVAKPVAWNTVAEENTSVSRQTR